jgi:RsiW-degrading membrane proteinase PrsW (M82 family)
MTTNVPKLGKGAVCKAFRYISMMDHLTWFFLVVLGSICPVWIPVPGRCSVNPGTDRCDPTTHREIPPKINTVHISCWWVSRTTNCMDLKIFGTLCSMLDYNRFKFTRGDEAQLISNYFLYKHSEKKTEATFTVILRLLPSGMWHRLEGTNVSKRVLLAKLHGITSQTAVIFVVTTMRIHKTSRIIT